MRCAAFLLVFILHAWLPHLKGLYLMGGVPSRFASVIVANGRFGVDLFFCLSAFLITTLLLKERDETGAISLKTFWKRRARRLFPLYFSFLAICLFILPPLNLGEKLDLGTSASFALFYGNIWSALADLPNSPMMILWSLSVEMHFYVLWPILMIFLRPKYMWWVAIGGLLLATFSRFALLAGNHWQFDHSFLTILTPSRIDPFMMGALFALMINGNDERREWNPAWPLRAALISVGLSLPMFSVFISNVKFSPESSAALWNYPLFAICGLFVLAGIYNQDSIKLPKLIISLGIVSYGLYLYHVLCIKIVRDYIVTPLYASEGPIGRLVEVSIVMILALALTAGISLLSYKFVELPFMKKRKRGFEAAPATGG